MPFRSHAPARFLLAALLPLLVVPTPASGAGPRQQRTPRAAAPAPVRPDNTIIPLPLNPVVPAGQRICSTTGPSGLGSTTLRAGVGARPGTGDVVLVNYIGFPFWDVLTFSVTSWRDLGEFDEIRIDRISPEDARTLGRGAAAALKGTAFMHFGAFFSRAFRENDYLWGRLHAVDRLFDIVCDSAGPDALAELDVPAFKRHAFDLVLRAEEAHLPNVQALIADLRAELSHLARAPGAGQHSPGEAAAASM